MNKQLLLGVFEDEHKMIHASEKLFAKGVEIFDIYTPFPVHGLDDLLKIKRTRLPIITFIGGSIGLSLAIGFQYWVSVVNWPINVGGKPFNSMAAFIPVAFEITVLFGAFITIFAFFFRSSLFPKIDKGIILNEVTENHFVVAIELKDASIDIEAMKSFFILHGAIKSETKGVVL
jgi:hypothetical protein